jgi:hypothetical protein
MIATGLRRVSVTTVAVEKQYALHTLRFCLTLVVQHAKRMRRIGVCLALQYFSTFSHKRHFLQEYLYESESIIIRILVVFVFLLVALFSREALGVVSFLTQLCRFEVTRSVHLSQP